MKRFLLTVLLLTSSFTFAQTHTEDTLEDAQTITATKTFLVGIIVGPVTFANLGTISPSTTMIFVSDGTYGSNPCTGGGTGALAVRVNAAWNCGNPLANPTFFPGNVNIPNGNLNVFGPPAQPRLVISCDPFGAYISIFPEAEISCVNGFLMFNPNGPTGPLEQMFWVKQQSGETWNAGQFYAFNATNGDFEVVPSATFDPVTGALTTSSANFTGIGAPLVGTEISDPGLPGAGKGSCYWSNVYLRLMCYDHNSGPKARATWGCTTAGCMSVAGNVSVGGIFTESTIQGNTSGTRMLGENSAGAPNWYSTPILAPTTSQKAETGTADANVLTVTPATAGNFRACVVVSVSSATNGIISWTLRWKDSNGNTQADIAQDLFQQGTPAPNTTFTTSAAGNYNGCTTFDVDSSATAIVVKWVGGGTTAAKVSATIEELI